jgi:hypothetical protein
VIRMLFNTPSDLLWLWKVNFSTLYLHFLMSTSEV